LQQDAGEKYDLGPAMLFLGRAAQERLGLTVQALPVMQGLAELADEGVNLGVLCNGQVLYVERVESRHILQANLRVGTQVPAHCTAIGKVLLAYSRDEVLERVVRERGLRPYGPNTLCSLEALGSELATIRSRGYSIDNEEFMEGVRCLAAPIRNERGAVVAGLAITGPGTRLSLERLQALKDLVMEAAAAISERLGYFAEGARVGRQVAPPWEDGPSIRLRG
jgi:DNA-binding IclR family transcriptional regulator